MLLVFSLSIMSSWASLPTLGVAEITVPRTPVPSFIDNSPTNNPDTKTNHLIHEQLANFTALIRSTIANSGEFKVVNLNDKVAELYNANESDTEIPPIELNSESATNTVPDYILTGSLTASNAALKTNAITNTNKYSAIYILDVAVTYKLIETKDYIIVAEFTAAGHAGDTKIISNSKAKPTINIPQLIKALETSLATEVNNSLKQHINENKSLAIMPESSPPLVNASKNNAA